MDKLIQKFEPAFTPKQMLQLGVFEGKYLNSTQREYPPSWFTRAKLVGKDQSPDPTLNLFGVKSRQPLSVWLANGWIHPEDPWGWFQWYCRYYSGRRMEDDERQIKRHRAFKRHYQQVLLGGNQDVTKRVVQRQALLQWSWDPFPDFKTKRGESLYQKARRIIKENRNA